MTIGAAINDVLLFELILNNANTGNSDYIVATREYHGAFDVVNTSNGGVTVEPFGEFTQKINIFPWDYITGYTIRPVGDIFTNPSGGEFNKLRIRLKNNLPYTSAEIVTATFYCLEEPT